MFNYSVNAMCINSVFNPATILGMKNMHDHMKRLYQAGRELGELTGDLDQSALARLLNVAQQNVSNWETRGISKEGALEAQRVLGVSATWILYGQGSPTVSTQWPFRSIDPHRFARLTPDQLAIVESAVRTALQIIDPATPDDKSTATA